MYFILYSNCKSIKTIPRPQEFYHGCPPPPVLKFLDLPLLCILITLCDASIMLLNNIIAVVKLL